MYETDTAVHARTGILRTSRLGSVPRSRKKSESDGPLYLSPFLSLSLVQNPHCDLSWRPCINTVPGHCRKSTSPQLVFSSENISSHPRRNIARVDTMPTDGTYGKWDGVMTPFHFSYVPSLATRLNETWTTRSPHPPTNSKADQPQAVGTDSSPASHASSSSGYVVCN